MQPSSLGYGSESDLARVLISCGQVANSSFGGSGRPLRPDNFLRRQGCSPSRSEGGCGHRHRRRPFPPPQPARREAGKKRRSQRSAHARSAVRRGSNPHLVMASSEPFWPPRRHS